MSVYASDFTDGLALHAIRLIVANLENAVRHGSGDPRARERMHNAGTIAGMAFGSLLPPELEPTIAFADVAGEVLSLLMWFVVGAAMLVPAFQHAQWQDFVFAVLALTVIRMVPVAIACFGSRLDRRTVAFIGWFGPRGIGTLVLGLIVVERGEIEQLGLITQVAAVTVTLSLVIHSATAWTGVSFLKRSRAGSGSVG